MLCVIFKLYQISIMFAVVTVLNNNKSLVSHIQLVCQSMLNKYIPFLCEYFLFLTIRTFFFLTNTNNSNILVVKPDI